MDPGKARRIAAIALVAGVVADLLFDGPGPGINVPIFVAAALAAVWLVRPGRPIDRLDWWIPPVAVLAASGVAIRADTAVLLLDVTLAAAGVMAWALAVSVGGLTRRSVAAVATLGVEAGVLVGLGAAAVLGQAAKERPQTMPAGSRRRLLPVIRGLLIAVPVVAVFALLLGSADAAFAGILDGLFHLGIDVDVLVRRGGVVAVIAWLTAGGLALAAAAFPAAFVTLVASVEPAPAPGPAGSPGEIPVGEADPAPGRPGRTGSTEALTVLVAVEVLFAAFVVVQVAYLFGGFATLTRAGLTYSEYARAGFFQLVAVVVGAGLLLLVGNALAGGSRAFRPVAVGLVVLSGVILVSAAARLGLYQQAYGWTELRFYVAAAICWLALCLSLALALVLAARMRWLLHGAAFAAIGLVLVVTAIGPQGFITRQNLARAFDPSLVPAGGRPGIDMDYVTSLDAGAIPDLVAALPRLPSVLQAPILASLRARREALEGDPFLTGWPAWNLERIRALDALRGLPDQPSG